MRPTESMKRTDAEADWYDFGIVETWIWCQSERQLWRGRYMAEDASPKLWQLEASPECSSAKFETWMKAVANQDSTSVTQQSARYKNRLTLQTRWKCVCVCLSMCVCLSVCVMYVCLCVCLCVCMSVWPFRRIQLTLYRHPTGCCRQLDGAGPAFNLKATHSCLCWTE